MKNEDIISAQSSTCSSICRQIVFVLGALSWSIVYSNLESKSLQTLPIVVIILVILYFSVDIMQYLYSYIKMRMLIYILDKAKYHPDYSEKDRIKMHEYYLRKRLRVEQITFCIFIIKISFLPFIVSSLICFFLRSL